MRKVKFGDVVNRVNIYVDRFNTERLYYVGKGGSIEPNALDIKPQAKIEGATIGFKFHFGFNPGHILFMSRCFDQHKAATATFAGVCSDSTYVVETRDESVLMQRYLQLVMQTDDFWGWCEEHKSGGVNFLINYSTLETYEFDLPSLDEQKVLADKLWAAYRVKESYRKLLAATDDMVKAKFVEMFGDIVANSKQWETKPISEVAPETASNHNQKGVVWNLNLDMIESNSGLLISKVMVPYEELNSVVAFDERNVLYSKLRPYLNKVIIPGGNGYATTELVPLRPNTTVLDKGFLGYLLRSDSFVKYADSIATGTKMPRMPLGALRKFPCILPPLPLQQQFVDIATQAEATKASLRQSIESIDRVIKSLINQ